MLLDGGNLKVHFIRPAVAVPKVLVLYGTGDGGWLGIGKQLETGWGTGATRSPASVRKVT